MEGLVFDADGGKVKLIKEGLGEAKDEMEKEGVEFAEDEGGNICLKA